MFGKRKRGDADDVLDVNAPIAQLLAAVVKWRDACGQAYRVQHKVDITSDRAVLRLQRFDRVTRAQAAALEALLGPNHPYCVAAIDFRLADNVVAITVTKRARAPPARPGADDDAA